MKTNEIDELRTFFNNIADNGKIEEVELMKAIKTPKRAEKLCEVLKITVRDPQCQVITNFFTRAEEEEDEDLNQDLNQAPAMAPYFREELGCKPGIQITQERNAFKEWFESHFKELSSYRLKGSP